MSEEEKPRMKYGSMEPLRRSGANNTVYLIPAEENGGTPEVFVWSNIGSGCPERAYHNRWYTVGSVHLDAVPDSIEKNLREYEDDLVAIAETYKGSKWDGNNHVGEWARTPEEDQQLDERHVQALEGALNEVACYWTASDYYAPVTLFDVVQSDLALDELVAAEIENAQRDDAYLESDDVRAYILSAAESWLEKNDEDADDERDSKLRGRLQKLLGPAGEVAS